jgi:twitching motility protein PilT
MSRYTVVERRKSRRSFFKLPIRCEIINPKDKTVSRKTMMAYNLNTNGIYLETDELVALDTEINMAFQLPGRQDTIHANSKVARLETIEEGKTFGVGVAFSGLSDSDKEIIQGFIELSNIHKLLELCIEKKASDLHLSTNSPPILRINGELNILDMAPLKVNDIPFFIYSLMTNQQIKQFEMEKELNFGYQFDLHNRFRINVHQQRGFVEAALRLINAQISSFEDLNIPEAVKMLARLEEGLVLIVGPSGSGKTTTISAMVELLNQEKKIMIITLEKPIEYLHTNIKSIIKQREVGVDTRSFTAALENSLKQDPDVLVIGELDNPETVKTAVVAAEAGHLVIASFHAPNTVQAIDRLANMFPPENRKQVLFQFAQCVKGVVTQLLVPRIDKGGRVLASEVAVANDAVKRVIRNDELLQLPTIIQTGSSYKMQSMYDSIKKLTEQNIISDEVASHYSEEFVKYR